MSASTGGDFKLCSLGYGVDDTIDDEDDGDNNDNKSSNNNISKKSDKSKNIKKDVRST